MKRKNQKLIGLSVTECIRDLIEGKVKYEQVIKIIAGTRFADEATWNKKIAEYREEEWDSNPDLAESYIRRLLAEGKIEQPRLENNIHFPVTRWGKGDNRFWVTDESQIVWNRIEGLPI